MFYKPCKLEFCTVISTRNGINEGCAVNMIMMTKSFIKSTCVCFNILPLLVCNNCNVLHCVTEIH